MKVFLRAQHHAGRCEGKVTKSDRNMQISGYLFTLLYRKRTQRALSARYAGVVRALGAPARERGGTRASVRLPRAVASGKPSAGAGGDRRERRREGASRANREHAGAAQQAEHARESEEATERAERTRARARQRARPALGRGHPPPQSQQKRPHRAAQRLKRQQRD